MAANPEAPAEFVEKRKFCCCLSLKQGILVFGVFLIGHLVIEFLNLVFILMNDNFDLLFGVVYLLLLAPLLVASLIYSFYYCSKESHKARSYLPWAFILGAVSSVLIGVWIILYICVIYKKDKVLTNRWDHESTP